MGRAGRLALDVLDAGRRHHWCSCCCRSRSSPASLPPSCPTICWRPQRARRPNRYGAGRPPGAGCSGCRP
ncbi:hypothetical protein C7E12_21155, partial [Stenotrophomonas maltophilia]